MYIKKQHIRILRIVGIISLLIWMYVIYSFSSDSGNTSSALSGNVVKMFYQIIEIFTGKDLYQMLSATHLDMVQHVFRKLAHMFIFFVLSVNAMCIMFTFPLKMYIRIFIALTFSFAYACFDEFHQLFVAGRAGQFRDVLIDTSGALIGIIFSLLLYCVIFTIYEKHMAKKYGAIDVSNQKEYYQQHGVLD
ncbi:VanZ family protein [Breznakia blatticola]|uniref:VanZ family protein n=1 Tax=Breznakia blatticola TaxID=1754012 RepID=A0A4R7ZKI1_9FIRM|nr:VanZ family protein [Breznakia blatticola]TDW16968.1 VanZ family protein [Breznakia blatticola]